jgi:hypothetical protein
VLTQWDEGNLVPVHAIRTRGGVEVQLHSPQRTAGSFTPQKIIPDNHWTGRWVGAIATPVPTVSRTATPRLTWCSLVTIPTELPRLPVRFLFIHSSVICQTHDRSTASSKTIPPLNAIYSFLLQIRVSSSVPKAIQQLLTSSCHFYPPLYLSFNNFF